MKKETINYRFTTYYKKLKPEYKKFWSKWGDPDNYSDKDTVDWYFGRAINETLAVYNDAWKKSEVGTYYLVHIPTGLCIGASMEYRDIQAMVKNFNLFNWTLDPNQEDTFIVTSKDGKVKYTFHSQRRHKLEIWE